MRFGHRKSCTMFVELRKVLFHCLKACRKFTEVRRLCFDHRKHLGGFQRCVETVLTNTKACWRLVELRRLRFDQRKTCKRLTEVRIDRFDHNACWRLEGVCRRHFDRHKTCSCLQSFGQCDLTTTKHVRGFQNSRDCCLPAAMRVRYVQKFGE